MIVTNDFHEIRVSLTAFNKGCPAPNFMKIRHTV